ncbi:hypothetical protein L345_15002, partial [Ophiophagus hannah]
MEWNGNRVECRVDSVKLASSQQRLLVLIQVEREAKVLKTIQKAILPSSMVLLEIHLLHKGLQETGERGMVLAGRAYYDGIAKIGDIAVASPVSKELETVQNGVRDRNYGNGQERPR